MSMVCVIVYAMKMQQWVF